MQVGQVLINKVDNYKMQNSEESFRISGKNGAAQGLRSITMEDINAAVDNLNKTAARLKERISFSYNQDANRIIMKVIDNDTNEVVREIPSKDSIEFLEQLQEFIGLFVDEAR